MLAAIDAADSLVNFKDYDRDNNGQVDMVYFLYAGIGAHIDGNDQRLLWPHASFITNPDGGYNWRVRKDGVTMGRYACSTELTGSATSNFLDGIGVICHEFGHVLGLPDLYDTDYEDNGQTAHPADWSIMAGGGYLNNGRTPCGYTLYERASLGFAVPQVFPSEGDYTLQPIGTSNTGYKLITPVRNEFFLIENRQNTSKWDSYLPGHGMLVFRVDSTSTSVWTSNVLNNNPEHMYFELVRAGGGNTPTAAPTDPFPGTHHVTMLDNETEPANLRTWAGKPTPFGLQNISESSDGVISFNLFNVNILKSISLPAQLAVGRGLSLVVPTTLKPATAIYAAQWTSSDESVATVSNDGLVTGVAVGECDITVEATSNGNMHSATCHIVVEEADMKAGIADFRAMPAGSSAAMLLHDALVVYVNGQDAYVRDATGAIVFANTGLPLQVGDCLNGFVSVFYLVELLVIWFELCQNFDRHIDVCGLNDDLLETSVKGSVLLHYFSEFIHGRRPYALDFAPCEGRFQHIGRVEASLGPSCTDYCMELIDKEYEVRIGPGLFYYRFQPLFKVSPEFGSGYYRCYIQRKDSFLCKRRGNIA